MFCNFSFIKRKDCPIPRCEGKVKILAVVGLPEETFRSAAATVKASLVFLKRFTKKDQKAWDAAWPAARAAHDATFAAERDALCATYAPGIVSGDDKKVADILTKLTALGVKRIPPACFFVYAPRRSGCTPEEAP